MWHVIITTLYSLPKGDKSEKADWMLNNCTCAKYTERNITRKLNKILLKQMNIFEKYDKNNLLFLKIHITILIFGGIESLKLKFFTICQHIFLHVLCVRSLKH